MTEPVYLVDTSVAIPLVVTGHEAHDLVTDSLDDKRLGLAGHAWFESFSVLTRLPPPARRSPADVVAILGHNFPASRFLDPDKSKTVIDTLVALGVSGGSVYDALVGYTAVAHGLPLVTRDDRALKLYRALGASVTIL
ncbi:MAG: type II toxin-antitoxin system VapC family toxin [Acidimicrobiia bacterium]